MNANLIKLVFGVGENVVNEIVNADMMARDFENMARFCDALAIDMHQKNRLEVMDANISKLETLHEKMKTLREHVSTIPTCEPVEFLTNPDSTAIRVRVNFPKNPETFILCKPSDSLSVVRGDVEGQEWIQPGKRQFGETVNLVDIAKNLNPGRFFFKIRPTNCTGPFRTELLHEMDDEKTLVVKIVDDAGVSHYVDFYKHGAACRINTGQFNPDLELVRIPAYC